jgi:hypothetical protein
MESIIKRVLKDQWDSIQSDVEKMAADKVKAKIEDQKNFVLANLNGTSVNKEETVTA